MKTIGAGQFKAIGDEKRMKILEMLLQGELCACKILEEFDLTQPTLSHHMKILCDSGVVQSRRDGKWMHYSINQDTMQAMETFLDALRHGRNQASPPPAPLQTAEKTRLYLLTGFLGSGKTTILSKLLHTLEGQRVGVIQNEFGKLGIDGDILKRDDGIQKKQDITITEINRGSIFCSCLKLNFVQALAEMAQKNLDYLFVESSGLGDPSNVEEILEAVKIMAGDRYDFQGAICLVDAMHFLEQRDDLETVSRQLKHCHLAVITKVDAVNYEQLETVKTAVRQINPQCPIRFSSNGDLNLSFLAEDLRQYQWAESEDTTNSVETKPKTISLLFQGQIEQDTLEKILDQVKEDTYRIKGFFHLAEQGWNQVDVVGDQIDYKPCAQKDSSNLVFISKIGPAIIKKVFDAWQSNTALVMQLKN